jgi:hypothetical protein
MQEHESLPVTRRTLDGNLSESHSRGAMAEALRPEVLKTLSSPVCQPATEKRECLVRVWPMTILFVHIGKAGNAGHGEGPLAVVCKSSLVSCPVLSEK